MVDYCDGHGNHFHKPMQAVAPPECVEADTEIIAGIRKELEKQGYHICGIVEALGDFEMSELEGIFNGGNCSKCPMRILFVDIDMAMKEAGL